MSAPDTYEATINIRHISTSPKARDTLSLDDAMNRATGNLRYITRDSAIWDGDIIGHSEGITMIAHDPADRRAAREMTIWALEARAQKHRTSTGIRLADTLIVSLPRDAEPDHHREMVAAIISDLGRDSDAWLIGAIHRDRAGNPHAHILAIDGLESELAAKARRPGAQRVRRADALHLNQGGNRQELRARIASQINAVSEREGYRRAEIRSYKDRGIERTPGRHDGPKMRAIDKKVSPWLQSDSSEPNDMFLDLPPQEPVKAIKTSSPINSESNKEQQRIRQTIEDRILARKAVRGPIKRHNIRY